MVTNLDFDEINKLAEISYYEGNPVDDLESLMIQSAKEGRKRQMDDLYWEYEDLEDKEIEKALYKKFDGKDFRDRIEGAQSPEEIARIFETECHRMFNFGIISCGREGMMKVWNTQLDPKVRLTHEYLESMEVDYGEDFWTFDGDHSPYPGLFQNASNNVNCRCWVSLKPTNRLTDINLWTGKS